MTDFKAWKDEITSYVASNEIPDSPNLLTNQLRFSDLNLSSIGYPEGSRFKFEGKHHENPFVQRHTLIFYLRLLESINEYGMNQFICYADTGNISIKVLDVVEQGYPEANRLIISNLLEINETDLRKGLNLEFARIGSDLSRKPTIYVFHIMNQSQLQCCAVFHGVKDNISDVFDSGGDSDSIEAEHLHSLEMNELDSYILPVTALDKGYSRKRSFLNREELPEKQIYPAQKGHFTRPFLPVEGLKKLKSARNLKQVSFSNRQIMPLVSRSSAFSAMTQSNLNRCASAPAIKLNSVQTTYDSNEIKAVYLLFCEIVAKSNDKFVQVMSKFLLSEKETLTKVIQKELCFFSSPEKVFSNCFQFISKNFPPFQFFCKKVNDKINVVGEEGLKVNIKKLSSDQQFDDFAFVSTLEFCDKSSPFAKFQHEWQVTTERRKHLKDFYIKLGFPEVVASCYEAIEAKQSIKYDSSLNVFVVDKQEKLFTPGKQRYIADGKDRPWPFCNPMLQERFNFQSSCCNIFNSEEKFTIEKISVGSQLKMEQSYEIASSGQLEITYCLYKAKFKANENWTLVYSTLVVFEKL